MLEIAWKSFLFNYRKRILYYLCVIIAMAEMFLFAAINWSLSWSAGDSAVMLEVLGEVSIHVGLLVISMMIVICYSLLHYVMERVKDYRVLLLMGVRSNRIIRILILEYFIGFIASLIGGILLGNGIYWILKTVVNRYTGNMMGTQMPDQSVYTLVIGLSVASMLLVAYVVFLWFGRQKSEDILLWEAHNEPRPSKIFSCICFIAGIAMMIIAWLVYPYCVIGGATMLVAVYVGWGFGVCLCITGGQSLILDLYENHAKPYTMQRIMLSQYNQKYKTIMRMIAVFLFLDVYILSLLSARIVTYLPIVPEKYAFDVVWMASEEVVKNEVNVVERDGTKVQIIPMVRLTDVIDDEVIGISENSFEKLTGEKLSLKEREIVICFQNWKIPQNEKKIISKSEWDKSFSGIYKTDYCAYKIGKWNNDTWNEYSHYVTLDDKYIYQVKKGEIRNLIGQLQVDEFAERLVVFSNAHFEEAYAEMRNKGDEATELLLFNIDDHSRKSVVEKLQSIQDKRGLKGEGSYTKNYFYDCEAVRTMLSKFNLAIVLCLIGVSVALLLSKLLILVIWILNSRDEYDEKLQILETIGISEKDEKHLIKREYQRTMIIAGIMAIISAFFLRNNYVTVFFDKFKVVYNNDPLGIKWMLCGLLYVIIEVILVKGVIYWGILKRQKKAL